MAFANLRYINALNNNNNNNIGTPHRTIAVTTRTARGGHDTMVRTITSRLSMYDFLLVFYSDPKSSGAVVEL